MLGVPVNFAFDTAEGICGTEFSGKALLQTADHEGIADEEPVRDATGKLVTRSFYNLGDKLTLEYIPKGSSLANAITNTALITIGAMVSITACANMPSLVKTNWCVLPGQKITKSNTTAARITLPMEAHPGITSVAS